VVIYGGIYLCVKCGATGSRKLVKLARECKHPTQAGKINRDAYAAGRPLPRYEGWPYKRVHHDDNIVINNFQMQLDRIQKVYEQPHLHPETDSDNDIEYEDTSEHENTQTNTNMGDSSSESD